MVGGLIGSAKIKAAAAVASPIVGSICGPLAGHLSANPPGLPSVVSNVVPSIVVGEILAVYQIVLIYSLAAPDTGKIDDALFFLAGSAAVTLAVGFGATYIDERVGDG